VFRALGRIRSEAPQNRYRPPQRVLAGSLSSRRADVLRIRFFRPTAPPLWPNISGILVRASPAARYLKADQPHQLRMYEPGVIESGGTQRHGS
jgi:hypothetical protein